MLGLQVNARATRQHQGCQGFCDWLAHGFAAVQVVLLLIALMSYTLPPASQFPVGYKACFNQQCVSNVHLDSD